MLGVVYPKDTATIIKVAHRARHDLAGSQTHQHGEQYRDRSIIAGCRFFVADGAELPSFIDTKLGLAMTTPATPLHFREGIVFEPLFLSDAPIEEGLGLGQDVAMA